MAGQADLHLLGALVVLDGDAVLQAGGAEGKPTTRAAILPGEQGEPLRAVCAGHAGQLQHQVVCNL